MVLGLGKSFERAVQIELAVSVTRRRRESAFRMQVRAGISRGYFAREREVLGESATGSGWMRCELGEKAMIVIMRDASTLCSRGYRR